jgi:AraC-like DNA-binding protein
MLKLVPINNTFEIKGFYSAIHFEWSDNFVFSGESHNFWEVVYVESGEVEVTEDENVYTLREGNIIFHAPMEFHRIKSAGGSSPKGFILSFESSGMLPDALLSGIFTLDPYRNKCYRDICDKLHDFFHGNQLPLVGQEVAAELTAFFIDLCTVTTQKDASKTRSASEYRALVSYMTESVCENLTLADIAKHNHVSVSYIKLLFNTYAGISPKSYFKQLRVRHATELLDRGLTAGEVADMMNFSSPNYFSAFYKKNCGITPTERQKKG